jgi:hypothetical protein
MHMPGIKGTAPGRREYRRPVLRKRQKLAGLTEGKPPVVTDGGQIGGKGGCFRRD